MTLRRRNAGFLAFLEAGPKRRILAENVHTSLRQAR